MTGDMTPERTTLPEAAVAAHRARREALHAAETQLRGELEALEAQPVPAAGQLRSALGGLLASLQEHAEEVDAPGGLLPQVIDAAPWFGSRTEQLRGEHAGLIGRAGDLIERTGQAEDGDAVAALSVEARALAADVSEHRHRGTALLMDAFLLDIPAGD